MLFLHLVLSFALVLKALGQACDPAPPCTPECQLPDCACSLSEPDIPLAERPQIVYLSFVEGMTQEFDDVFLSRLFDGQFSNPNGCPISATHYVAAYDNDYTVVNQYYNRGHEIASNGISGNPDYNYWWYLSEQGWADEMGGMKRMLGAYANIPEESVLGTHAPNFCNGGEPQFAMMDEEGFMYDYTQASRQYGYINMADGAWPFTADYSNYVDCNDGYCPTCSYPGIWNQPFLALEDSNYGAGGNPDYGNFCDLLDYCAIPGGNTGMDLFRMLKRNFDRAYKGNTRAPIGFMTTPKYFDIDWHIDGYIQFLDYITRNYDNVWFVPIQAGIQYRSNPVTNQDLLTGALDDFFGCQPMEGRECDPVTCTYYNVETDMFEKDMLEINMCSTTCPEEYPWLGNPYGEAQE